MPLAIIVGRLPMLDPHAKARWIAQQELGRFAETVESWSIEQDN